MEKKSIEIYMHAEGKVKPEVLRIEEDATIEEVIAAGVKAGALQAGEDIHMYITSEDEHKPHDHADRLHTKGVRHGHHVHCHLCENVRVEIIYNDERRHHEFSPATRIRRILEWAIREVGLIGNDAADKMLTLLDGTELADMDSHIGSYVQYPHCHIQLALVARVVVNG